MKKQMILIFFLVLGSINSARALGDEKENGGDVIFCGPDGATRLGLLDLYEAQKLFHWQLVPAKGQSTEEIFEERMKAFEGRDPVRAALYRGFMQSFSQEARFVPESDFTDVPDEGFKAPPQGCQLRQIVIQYDKPAPDGTRYMINESLWNAISNEDRAALLLHEFIYREGRLPENSFKTSSGVRYLNGLIHSTQLKDLSLQEYITHLRAAGFQTITAQGEPLILYSWNPDHTQKIPLEIEFHSKDVVQRASLGTRFVIPGIGTEGDQVSCRTNIQDTHEVSFFDDGSMSTIQVGCEAMAYRFSSANIEGFVFGKTFTYEGGKIRVITATQSTGTIFSYSALKYDFRLLGFLESPIGSMNIEFFASGLPHEVSVTSFDRWELVHNNGINDRSFFQNAHFKISFSTDGNLQDNAL